MKNITTPYPLFFTPVFLLLGLFGSIFFLLKFSKPVDSSLFYYGLSLDLLILLPTLYGIAIWKTKLPNTSIVLAAILGLFIGKYGIPEEHHFFLNLFQDFFLPFIEIGILLFIIWKARSAFLLIKQKQQVSISFFDSILSITTEQFPEKLAHILTTEISMVYYAFFKWRKPNYGNSQFTYHKKSSAKTILIVFIGLILVETTILHIVLVQVNYSLAYVLSGLSIYTAFQFFAIIKSMQYECIEIQDEAVLLPFGILNRALIPFTDIERIEVGRKKFKGNSTFLSPVGDLESHNISIHCKGESTISGFLGIKKQFRILYCKVDLPELFQEKLVTKIQQSKEKNCNLNSK